LAFLKEHLLPLIKQEYAKSTVETQTYFRDRIIKILPTAKEEETVVLLELLNCFPQYKIQDLVATVDLFVPQIENKPIKDNIKKIFHFMKSLIFKQTNENISCKIFDLYLNKIIPIVNEFDESTRTEVFSYLAQLSPIMNSTDSAAFIEPIFNYFKSVVPVAATNDQEIDLPYFIIESILYSFCNFGSKSLGSIRKLCGYKTITGQPSDMNSEVDPTKFADLLSRFRFLDEKSRETSSKAQKVIQTKPLNKNKNNNTTNNTTTTTTTTNATTTTNTNNLEEEKSIRQLAKKTLTATKNINTLIAQLSKNPPVLTTSSIQLSTSIRLSLNKHQNIQNKKLNQSDNNQNNNQNKNNNNQNKNNNQNNNNNNNNPPKVSGPIRNTKQTRYQPYVVPGRKQEQKDDGGDGPAHLHIFTEKHKKPSNFKGRGNKNY